MNFEDFEKLIKTNKATSIILIVVFLFSILFEITDSYKKVHSYFITKEYDLKIELLKKDRNYIHVNSATSRLNPFVSSIGSWYKFRLTNIGEKPYSIINIFYKEKQKINAFKDYYINNDVIYLSNLISLPSNINANESIELYLFIPFEINRKLGEKLFSLLYTRDNKLDTYVELYLFGKEPKTKKVTVPMYTNEKFVKTVNIDVKITNWDEHFAHRALYSKMDRKNNRMPFDYNMNDGFSYQEKDEILSNIIKPTKDEIKMHQVYKNKTNVIPIVFEINNNMKFTIDLTIDSTGLLLTSK